MSLDGKRILINKPEISHWDPLEITLVTDWGVELRRLVPTPR